MDVSIIIVNYNTSDLLKNCLNSIYNNTVDVQYEIIVSDNASTDNSENMIKKYFPKVIFIKNNQNFGFGKANNIAKQYATGKYVFYLNSDTILLNNAVKIFYDFWEQRCYSENIGALGCYLTKNGENVHSYGIYPTKKSILSYYSRAVLSSSILGNIYHILKKKQSNQNDISLNTKKICSNEYITGADLFLKNDENALFDERFFMYFEETDLQYNNIYKKSKQIYILSTPKIEHLEGGSEKLQSTTYSFKKLTSLYFWKSCIIYVRKNIQHNNLFILLLRILLTFTYLSPRNINTTIKYIKQIWKE